MSNSMLNDLICEINKAKLLTENLEKAFVEECLKLGKVKGLVEYLNYINAPHSLYNSFSREKGEFYRFGNVSIVVVYSYDCTEIVGLTTEEFSELKTLYRSTEIDNECYDLEV